MKNLEPLAGTELTTYALQLLAASDIRTVREFISEGSDRLSKITNLSECAIADIVRELRRRYGPKRTRHKWPTSRTAYHTGIHPLDEMLGHFSQLSAGSVWEVCGATGIGKTQLCHTLALNFVSNRLEYDDRAAATSVLYIDTKGDFSGTRIRQMLRHRTTNTSECGRLMQQIKVERTLTAVGVVGILEELLMRLGAPATVEDTEETAGIKLVVIDSLPAVWFRFNNENESLKGKYWLEQLANLVYKVAMQHLVAVVMVNLSLAKDTLLNNDLQCSGANVDMEVNANERDTNLQIYNMGSDELAAQPMRPALGRYWSSVPRLRLSIEMPAKTKVNDGDEHQGAERIVKVLQSCCSSTGQSCQVRITNAGVE